MRPAAALVGCPLGMRHCWHPRESSSGSKTCARQLLSLARRPRGVAYVPGHVDTDLSPSSLFNEVGKKEKLKIDGNA